MKTLHVINLINNVWKTFWFHLHKILIFLGDTPIMIYQRNQSNHKNINFLSFSLCMWASNVNLISIKITNPKKKSHQKNLVLIEIDVVTITIIFITILFSLFLSIYNPFQWWYNILFIFVIFFFFVLQKNTEPFFFIYIQKLCRFFFFWNTQKLCLFFLSKYPIWRPFRVLCIKRSKIKQRKR